jgi:hypothetical protein
VNSEKRQGIFINGNKLINFINMQVGGFPALRLCQNWWNAQDIVREYSVDEIGGKSTELFIIIFIPKSIGNGLANCRGRRSYCG